MYLRGYFKRVCKKKVKLVYSLNKTFQFCTSKYYRCNRMSDDKEVEQDAPEVVPTVSGPKFGIRHIQAILMFTGLINAYGMRVNLSVGIVAMTDKTANSDFPVMDWDTTQKGIILSSFFWGYMMFQIPAGQLAGKFGPKYLLTGALIFCGILTVLTPYTAERGGWIALIGLRVLQGLGQGFIYPCVNTLLSKWAPPLERSRLFAFVFSGTQLGTVLSLFVAGQLAAGPGGWPSIFYVTGAVSVLWALIWVCIGADSPAEHRSISDSERSYIQSSLIHSSSNSKSMKVPWKDIVVSVPMWALLTTHMAQNWGFWTLLTLMPSYINSVLGFDIKNNGVLSSLPYLGNFILTLIFSWIADTINTRNLLPLSTARKMWNSIGLWGGAVALVLLATVANTVKSAVALLTLSVSLNSGTFMGYLMNHLDLAPNFAGVLMGITNGLANVTSILGPMIAGFIVTDETDEDEWKIVFIISAAVFFLGNSVFVLFGSTDVQRWNDPNSAKDKREGA